MMNRLRNKYYFIIAICCCFAAICSVGIPFNCAGIFYSSISEDLGIGIGSVTLYVTIASLCAGFAAPLSIKIYQKHNPKPIIMISTLLSFFSYIGISTVVKKWQLYFFALTLGFSVSFYGMSSINYFLSGWFSEKFGLVIGIAQGCSGLGGALLNGILSRLLLSFGWRKTYYVLAGVTFLLMIPSCFFIRREATEVGLPLYGRNEISQTHHIEETKKGGTLKVTWQLLTCCVVAFLCCFVTGFPSHLTTFAISRGFTVSIGASITSACMFGNLFSKFITGFLCDRIGAKKSCFIMIGIAIMGFVAILFCHFESLILLYIATFMAGACYAIHGVGLSTVSKDVLDSNAVSLGYSYMQFAAALGSGFAFSVFGYLYDIFGGYSVALIVIIIFLTISFILLTLLYKLRI